MQRIRAFVDLLDSPSFRHEPDVMKASGLLIMLADHCSNNGQDNKAYSILALAIKMISGDEVPEGLVQEAIGHLDSLAFNDDNCSRGKAHTLASHLPLAASEPTKEMRAQVIASATVLHAVDSNQEPPADETPKWLQIAIKQVDAIIQEVEEHKSMNKCETSLWSLVWNRNSTVDILSIGSRRTMGKTMIDKLGLPLPDWVGIDCLADPFWWLGSYYEEGKPM
jgi:hypothetical protein